LICSGSPSSRCQVVIDSMAEATVGPTAGDATVMTAIAAMSDRGGCCKEVRKLCY
jgi:hypothetical protein